MFSPHLFTCSIVAFETVCWGGNTTLGAHPKIILPRVSLPQLIFVPSQLVFVVSYDTLFQRPRVEKKFGEAARMSNLIRSSSISLKRQIITSPAQKTRLILSDLYSRFRLRTNLLLRHHSAQQGQSHRTFILNFVRRRLPMLPRMSHQW